MATQNTPRKPTGPKLAPVGAAPKVHFSLEVAEAERATERDSEEAFTADIHGRSIVFTNARDLDWKELLEIENPVTFLRLCVSPEDKDWFLEQRITGAGLQALTKAYQGHYGLGSQGNDDASRT